MGIKIDSSQSSPDHILLNGELHKYTDSDALAFMYDSNEGKTYVASKFGISHGKLYSELYRKYNRDFEEENIIQYGNTNRLWEGRLWLNQRCVITWDNITDPQVWKNIITSLEQATNEDLNDVYLLNVDGQVVRYSDFVGGNTNIAKQSTEDKAREEERMKQERAKHLMTRDEKMTDPEMSAYLKDREANIGKKLSYSNGKGEMTMAQWRALHNTSESVAKRVNKRMIAEAADGVIDGHSYLTYNNYGAFPVAYDMDIDEVFVGDFGETDDKMFNRIYSETENPDMNILLGRYWSDMNIIGFWNDLPDRYMLDEILDEITDVHGFYMNRNQLRIVVDDTDSHREGFIQNDTYLVSYEDFVNGDLTNKYVEPAHYEQEYALHLADAKTKHDKLSGYLQNRYNNIGRKLTSADGKKEMSQAEYNALRTFSESKQCGRTLVLTESQLEALRSLSDD